MSTANPTFDSELAELRSDVAQQGTVIASAVSVFNSLVGQMAKAEQSAITAGATPDQIAAITQIRTGIESNTVSLATAIHANTEGGPVEEPAPAAPAAPVAPAGSIPLVPPVPTPTGVVVTTDAGVVETPTLSPTTGATTALPVTEPALSVDENEQAPASTVPAAPGSTIVPDAPAAPEQAASPDQPAT